MSYLPANWPAPANICALTTQRFPGHSLSPFDANNLGLHVNDDPQQVLANRAALVKNLQLPAEPAWLTQTHSTDCIVVENTQNREADAAITRSENQVLAIMTADCLPITLCNKQGTEIAAIHAGWRGLLNGVVENTISKMDSSPADLMAWIGPAICADCYEVGSEVLHAYQEKYDFAASCFAPLKDKWLANLPELAKKILNKMSIFQVYSSNVCTFEQKNQYFSWRRDSKTGRMVTLIWLKYIQDEYYV